MTSRQQYIIYQGNSVISVETHPDYAHPVVIKKFSKRHPSRRHLRSLEKEYEITRSLHAVAGVRKVLGRQSIEGQPALILEYIDGETLQWTDAASLRLLKVIQSDFNQPGLLVIGAYRD